jgi:Uma2 family endonuclease
MKTNATDVKNRFGYYLRTCREEDIYITKNEKIIAVLSGFDDSKEGYLAIKEGSTAYNYSGKKVTYEEFLEITEGNEERYEYIDGEVYLLASPGMTHQIIHSNLYGKFLEWFEGKNCRVFSAPFDVTLLNEEFNSKNIVQPDLLITCDHEKTRNEKDRYMGIPSLVIEIISPQARGRDMVKKLDVYLKGGVSEYWIIDPQKHQILLYHFIDNQPETVMLYNEGDTVKSLLFKGLDLATNDIFKDI